MAEKDKKFYWLKLKTEFMQGEIVDFLMSQKNGANYVVLYQMLAIKTMNTQGRLCSEIGEVLIPFDPEKIQRECKWFDIDTIRVAMELYCKLGLIYRNKDNILQIANFEEMVGSETYWAKIKRIERKEENVGQLLENVQQPLISNISISNSNNINIEEKENKKNKRFIPPTLEEIQAYIDERNSSVDAQQFYDYFNAGNWVDSKGNKVKNWKQKLITWEKYDKHEQEEETFEDILRRI